MSFKIKGVAAGSAKGPYRKGEIIPLSPEEKLIVQCSEEVCKQAEPGTSHLVVDANLEGGVNVIKGIQDQKTGKTLSQYQGTVQISYRELDLETNRVKQPVTRKFQLHIEDTFDDLGVDDLKTISCKEA